MTGCDSAQLQPKPLRAADHDRDRHRLGDRHRSHRSSAAEPHDPFARRASRRHRHAAARLLDQPQRRRRQDRLHRRRSQLRHPLAAALSRVLQGRQPRNRKLRAARPAARLRLPRPAAARQPLPDLPRRRRLRHPRQAGRNGHAGSGDRPAGDHLHRPAAEPAYRLQHALLRIRARRAGDADPVRHLPGHDHLHPLGLEPRDSDLDPVLHPRLRAERGGLPRPGQTVQPELSRPPRQATPPGRIPPSQST